jgi:hypothetical protein
MALNMWLTIPRRRTGDLPGSEDYEVLPSCTFGWRDLCSGDLIAHATAHPRTGALTSPMDPTVPDGPDWYQSGSTSNATTPTISTIPSCSSSISAESREFNLSQRYKRKSTTDRTQEFPQD